MSSGCSWPLFCREKLMACSTQLHTAIYKFNTAAAQGNSVLWAVGISGSSVSPCPSDGEIAANADTPTLSGASRKLGLSHNHLVFTPGVG